MPSAVLHSTLTSAIAGYSTAAAIAGSTSLAPRCLGRKNLRGRNTGGRGLEGRALTGPPDPRPHAAPPAAARPATALANWPAPPSAMADSASTGCGARLSPSLRPRASRVALSPPAKLVSALPPLHHGRRRPLAQLDRRGLGGPSRTGNTSTDLPEPQPCLPLSRSSSAPHRGFDELHECPPSSTVTVVLDYSWPCYISQVHRSRIGALEVIPEALEIPEAVPQEMKEAVVEAPELQAEMELEEMQAVAVEVAAAVAAGRPGRWRWRRWWRCRRWRVWEAAAEFAVVQNGVG
ncbi:hypothetical protein BRADI_1g39231v3 [Brachypodium distachyon]|uniref:Uncharacterized protein n=1 Tax=Brachypodium distachyon TaxID=15368 RepID=A0A2K2DNJ7_BRADI|nr:hypothetical protein BRADI_1g39231v3 [Brachypodium distachyon]